LLKKSGYSAACSILKAVTATRLCFCLAVDDYVSQENPVRFIEASVDQCDLQEAGFRRVQPKDTGRLGYDPADLLKLYIYGYVNRVRSSRRLEAETARNLEVIWLLRGLRPDFKTIADFRKDNLLDGYEVQASAHLYQRQQLLFQIAGSRSA
jgi:transposase